MPRPGHLTRGRANRTIRTPGGRFVVHRQKFYRAKGTCAESGRQLQLPRRAKHRLTRKASHSSKRPNRPYGGKLTSKALKRGITRQLRNQ
ncbi:MAG: 50S ribosomal protein L34e [Candidatus Thorarchaeota archaeon]|nr:MAG: 50S ribosomal protein L34e [Candidatus Thorarchaeota archaeon]